MQQLSAQKRSFPFFLVASFIIMPAMLVALFFLNARFGVMHGYGLKNKMLLAAPFILLLFFLYIIAFSSRSLTAIGYIILASFCVYVFFVLKLTGYFDLSFRLASPDWLHNIKQRIHSHERINLTPFKVFHIYSASNVQIIGNFIMLIPLGIYIGLFINNPSFIKAFTIILLTTVSIELMQLLTNYRSTDIDDVILNTTGGIMGWIIYQTVLKQLPIKKGR